MRLTQYSRKAFVSAVMADVPRKSKEEVIEECQAAFVKAMSPSVRNIYKKNPKALRVEYLSIYKNCHSYIVGDADIRTTAKPFRDKDEAYADLEKKLTLAINACSTTDQVKKMLPEFAKYLTPEMEKNKYPLALTNIVPDFINAGWPKKK